MPESLPDGSHAAQATADEEHLRVLSLLYFIYGGIAACFSLVGLVFLIPGTIMTSRAAAGMDTAPDQTALGFAGCSFAAIGSALFVAFAIAAVIRILVGFALRRHRYYTLCLVAAAVNCLELPLGAALGIATLIVLLRPSVDSLFKRASARPPPAPSAAAAP